MNRRKFLKFLGCGVVASVVPAEVIAKTPKMTNGSVTGRVQHLKLAPHKLPIKVPLNISDWKRGNGRSHMDLVKNGADFSELEARVLSQLTREGGFTYPPYKY